ncbi:hypothetical protein AVEN_150372-1 [Araneus ventricosus]|uniref:Uncharacterized protein n=1 Tax=Araneus ventricosus TaxID=182803 RepID=A0A4Y2CQY5_ARAVE|nr:hypothetical protein AVEN_150372-1 [Araneus ventricosus]
MGEKPTSSNNDYFLQCELLRKNCRFRSGCTILTLLGGAQVGLPRAPRRCCFGVSLTGSSISYLPRAFKVSNLSTEDLVLPPEADKAHCRG